MAREDARGCLVAAAFGPSDSIGDAQAARLLARLLLCCAWSCPALPHPALSWWPRRVSAAMLLGAFSVRATHDLDAYHTLFPALTTQQHGPLMPAMKPLPSKAVPEPGLSRGGDSPPDLGESVSFGVDLSGLDGLTLFQKKCVLVNREIDRQGMGRYQWYIWTLCGFGYFLDLLWAQAFGLVLSPLQQELGFSNSQSGNISTSFNAGLTAGAFFWGFMSDIVGKTLLEVCSFVATLR